LQRQKYSQQHSHPLFWKQEFNLQALQQAAARFFSAEKEKIAEGKKGCGRAEEADKWNSLDEGK
jgi:hypothetical protein